MSILEHIPLSSLTYYQLGGKARYVLEITSKEDALAALQFIHEKQISDIRIIGLGSNLVLPDEDFDGAVIWMHGGRTSARVLDGNQVIVFAGDTVDSLITYAFSQGLVGLEWAGGLPSTVGGAVRGNAGAFGSEIKETFVSVEAIDLSDPTETIQTFTKSHADFSYRNSFFKQHPNLLLVSATFQLEQATKEELEKARGVYEQNIEYRDTHHPMEYPSCGSVFKNITHKDEMEKIFTAWPDVRELSEQKWYGKVSMGYLIKRLGFSGKKIGGAQVSEKHANYIVNVDHAKAADVRNLISSIQAAFQQTFGFTPEPEVVIV